MGADKLGVKQEHPKLNIALFLSTSYINAFNILLPKVALCVIFNKIIKYGTCFMGKEVPYYETN